MISSVPPMRDIIFLNPLMLLGVGAAVLPLVLHLLSRARYRTVDWSAMMFLQGGDSAQRRSSRLNQFLLLLLRMAIVAALAVALARPVLRGAWGGAAQEGRLAAAIIVDCSGSMAFEENGVSRMDLAKGAARQVLESLEPGDLAGIVFTGNESGAGADAQNALRGVPLTTDLQSVADRISAARPVAGRSADMPDALDRAARMLELSGASARDIYVISDRQASPWNGVDEAFAATWKSRLAQAPPTRLLAMPVGSTDVQNVAVEGIELIDSPAIRGRPAELEVRLRNYGPVQRAGLPLVVTRPGQPPFETKIDMAADSMASVKVPVRVDQAGSYVVSASVKTTGLTSDDSLESVVEVVDPIKVLILSGDERQGAFRSESDFLRVALAPFASSGAPANVANADVASVQAIPVEKWTNEPALSSFQVVVLANVDLLSRSQTQSIEQYVYGGGGLLITLGNLTRADDYNETLYRDGAGVLPAELDEPTPADGSQATNLLGFETDHPVFRFLSSRRGVMPSVTVGRYFPATPRRGGSRTLASYASGHPFLIEYGFGKGRALLMTTTIDADWTTLPLTNFYLPMMQSVVRYLAAVPEHNLSPGLPIRVPLTHGAADRSTALLRRPGKADVPLPISRSGDSDDVRYDDTEQPGAYTIVIREGGKETFQYFVVRSPRGESDLTRVEEERWKALERDVGLRRVEPGQTQTATALSSPRGGWDLWAPAVGVVLLLCMLELVVGRNWVRQNQ